MPLTVAIKALIIIEFCHVTISLSDIQKSNIATQCILLSV